MEREGDIEERRRRRRGEEVPDYTKSILTIWIPHLHHSQERVRIVFKKLLKCSCPHSGSTETFTLLTVQLLDHFMKTLDNSL